MFIINMQEKICRFVEVNHITLPLTYYPLDAGCIETKLHSNIWCFIKISFPDMISSA